MGLSGVLSSLHEFFFYLDERIGYKGRPFRMLKFRTLQKNAKALEKEVVERIYVYGGNDPRVRNWFCHLLRDYHLDELPNLWNVLRGEMGLIGLRPMTLHCYDMLPEGHRERRGRYLPGCINPLCAANPVSNEDVVDIETRYLDRYDRSPADANIEVCVGFAFRYLKKVFSSRD